MRHDSHNDSVTGLPTPARPHRCRSARGSWLCHAGSASRWDPPSTRCGRRRHRRRFPYIGKEKDEETGLGYHSARYYAGWLGRWCGSDPAGWVDGVGRYSYVGGRPPNRMDVSGLGLIPPPVSSEIEGKPAQTPYDPVFAGGRVAKEAASEIDELLEFAGSVGLELTEYDRGLLGKARTGLLEKSSSGNAYRYETSQGLASDPRSEALLEAPVVDELTGDSTVARDKGFLVGAFHDPASGEIVFGPLTDVGTVAHEGYHVARTAEEVALEVSATEAVLGAPLEEYEAFRVELVLERLDAARSYLRRGGPKEAVLQRTQQQLTEAQLDRDAAQQGSVVTTTSFIATTLIEQVFEDNPGLSEGQRRRIRARLAEGISASVRQGLREHRTPTVSELLNVLNEGR